MTARPDIAPLLTAILLLLPHPGASAQPEGDPLALVDGGGSAFTIYRAPDAVPSVEAAAEELQRAIELSTGVRLSIRTNATPPMICLGDNALSRQAGVATDNLAEEGFRIVTRGGNLYIVGSDTPGSGFEWGTRWITGLHYTHRYQKERGLPEGATAWGGGVSYGTLFGVYAFLENVVGARWLMPGEIGEDIPRHEALTVSPLDVTDAPRFLARNVMGVGEISGTRPDVKQWKTRLRLGGSWSIRAGHIWHDIPPRETLRANPEFMALLGETRQPVPKDHRHVYANGRRYQPRYCTTNPDLVRAFAQAIGTWVETRPSQRFFSVSPTDGSGQCQCEACQGHVERGTSEQWGNYGSFNRSITPLILKFYNDVATVVHEEYPDRFVGGYAYYDYTYPPERPTQVHPNVFVILAPLRHYGLTRYKPHYEREFIELCKAWRRLTPNLGYSDYPTWMRNGIGAPLGPSKPILKHTFAALRENGFRTAEFCGLRAWGYGALHNYVCAKLMWDADANVNALCAEWLDRAYGPAATPMAELYDLLDREMAAYKRDAPESIHDYEMTSDLALTVYLANFERIEALYRQAAAKVATDAERGRLEMFGANLVVLHHVLDEAGVLTDADTSVFDRTEPQYREFLIAQREALAIGDIARVEDTGGITSLLIPEQKQLTVARLTADTPAPSLDGDLSEPAWAQAAAADGFYRAGTKQPTAYATSVRVLFDDASLYLGFRCSDDDTVGTPAAHDTPAIYDGDVVELLFCNGLTNTHWLLTVNPAGARRDELLGGGDKGLAADRPWECATAVTEEGWTAEMRLPFTAIEARNVHDGTTWGVNLIRMNRPKYERSYWTNVDRDIRASNEMGAWHFRRK